MKKRQQAPVVHPSFLVSLHLVGNEKPGEAAAQRWADQLYRAGAKIVLGIAFDMLIRPTGQPIEDLADYATLLNLDKPRPSYSPWSICLGWPTGHLIRTRQV